MRNLIFFLCDYPNGSMRREPATSRGRFQSALPCDASSLLMPLDNQCRHRSNRRMSDPLAALLQLSHDLGREDRPFAILGEGNTSARLNGGRFAVKASGCSLGTLTADNLT